ncbi:MAG: diaminopimelate epimerase [Clostridia bacterium]|nr:diaminopimelate epimerase [Clostridia bacterium]
MIEFTKMQAAGNDYVYIDCRRGIDFKPEKLARAISRRHYGVGADGIILICRSDSADAKMRIFNSDGTEAMMCANGIRCVAKWLYDRGQTGSRAQIETLSGILPVAVNGDTVTVDMGVAAFAQPMKLRLGDEEYEYLPVNVGNSHACFFGDMTTFPLTEIGARLDHIFNTEIVTAIDKTRLRVAVYESGSGLTLSCGSGACASVYAASQRDIVPRGEDISVEMPGGVLTVNVGDTVTLSGEVHEVYTGQYAYDDQ